MKLHELRPGQVSTKARKRLVAVLLLVVKVKLQEEDKKDKALVPVEDRDLKGSPLMRRLPKIGFDNTRFEKIQCY